MTPRHKYASRIAWAELAVAIVAVAVLVAMAATALWVLVAVVDALAEWVDG